MIMSRMEWRKGILLGEGGWAEDGMETVHAQARGIVLSPPSPSSLCRWWEGRMVDRWWV